MSGAFEVLPDEIDRLTDRQLPQLLRQLLFLEARSGRIPLAGVSVALQINVSDGGEDGSIEWAGLPSHTDFIPHNQTQFQVKASNISPQTCYDELFVALDASKGEKPKGRSKKVSPKVIPCLKPRVADALKNGWHYVMFCKCSFTSSQIKKRKNKLSEAFADAGLIVDESRLHFYDGNRIAAWVNRYPSAVALLFKFIGRVHSTVVESWDSWAGKNAFVDFEYIFASRAKAAIGQLRAHFSGPQKIARVVGLPGIGKSRLVLETFRPSSAQSDIAQDQLSRALVYVDAPSSEQDLIALIQTWRSGQVGAVVVVDNCNETLHKQLRDRVLHRDSQLSLLTIDYDRQRTAGEESLIVVEPSPDDVIEGILKQAYPGLDKGDISRIVEFAQGFPEMAVQLGRRRLQNITNIGALNDRDLSDKFLWGRDSRDDKAQQAVMAIALFSSVRIFGFDTTERDYVAELAGLKSDELYSYVQLFIERGVVERRGDLVQVRPLPLAINLAGQWWARCAPEKAKSLFADGALLDELAERLCDQLAKADFLPAAQELVGNLCDERAPFGSAEVLNTARGSRCFRSFVEVNPSATANAIERVFSGWTTDQLRQVHNGRRNLVWALEKLCFRSSTFPTAAPLLLRFGAAENEAWTNNATGLFVQLYRIALCGTQAAPAERLAVIDAALASEDQLVRKVAVHGLGAALQTRHFIRTVGAEHQGSNAPLPEYQFSSREQVHQYWQDVITRLTAVATDKSDCSSTARDALASHIRSLLAEGLLDEVVVMVRAVGPTEGGLWPKATDQLRQYLRYEGKTADQPVRESVEDLLQVLTPSDLAGKLSFFVSIPNWDHDNDAKRDLAGEAAEALGQQCAKNLSDVLHLWPRLFSGEQRKGFAFGRGIAGAVALAKELVDESLDALRKIPPENCNPIVLGGILSVLNDRNPADVTRVLENVASDQRLVHLLVDLTRFKKIQSVDLLRITSAVAAGKIRAGQLRIFGYAGLLASLPSQEFEAFIRAILQASPTAVWVAVDLIGMYTFNETTRRAVLSNLIRDVLTTQGLFSDATSPSSGDSYQLEQLAISYFSSAEADGAAAQQIVREIVSACNTAGVTLPSDHLCKPLLRICMDRFIDDVWPILGLALLSEENYFLGSLLRAERGTNATAGLIQCVPEPILLRWCEEHPNDAPRTLIRLVPLLAADGSGWTSLVSALIKEYGQREEFLGALAAAMHTFGWVGSSAPYYESYLDPIRSVAKRHKSLVVKKWATEQLASLQRRIKMETTREAELEFGVMSLRH